MRNSLRAAWPRVLMGAGVFLVAVVLGVGAVSISAEAGYQGVGPNFLPWVVCLGLALCGLLLAGTALRGDDDGPVVADASAPDWRSFSWVSAGLLFNAALITTAGFVLSCALCFMFAAHGLRQAAGQAGRWPLPRQLGTDFILGLAIAAPVYWMFTQLLAINLPGLTATGWL
jgi:putative tricarboxylic transport membrane protein